MVRYLSLLLFTFFSCSENGIDNNIDLDKSVELYEKGMVLKNNCEEKLKKVELQIKKIKLQSNKIKKENFE